MKKTTRLWVRAILLIVMVGLIGFALYEATTQQNGRKPETGQEAPNFTLTSLTGQEVQLRDLRGKAVMLNFWGSWCEPCRSEMPTLQKMYTKYRNQGFEVVGINIAETDVAAEQFIRQYELTFPIWMDRDRGVVRLYRIGPIPSSIFIDSQGKITYIKDGPLSVGELETHILPILPRK
jgi:peroxiredoxin